jgi:hypothetical protein
MNNMIKDTSDLKDMDVIFQSELPSLMRSQLEAVFFFNPKQSNWAEQISHVVEQYGVPEIRKAGGKITIALRGNAQTQTLFGVNPQQPDFLESVIIYSRFNYPELLVVHLALARFQLASTIAMTENSRLLNFLGLVTAFSKLVKRITGVERLRFACWNLVIPVV